MSWQDQYEQAAQRERTGFDELPVDTLLRYVEAGQYGDYYGLWHSVAQRATLQQAGWVLFRVLQREELAFLVRCTCAEALLRLLGRTDELALLNEAVNLSSGTMAMHEPYRLALQHELANRLNTH
ncbi:hypothetical protein FAES_1651 [Fibrella aestuarina BUZ 2]|uniref:Uncharacterized protein n=1 Tax=Fibrella aestuarina BUZ 2 TaxID=1166018 RepID=I0K6A8_9BACT|nr:hypothetical protein [Fibrella aestuarina]CCG99661.1 hypothetical protein FAES_1651 [Fibrella aestuarina BUZ 2]